jgi:hypothetical protein
MDGGQSPKGFALEFFALQKTPPVRLWRTALPGMDARHGWRCFHSFSMEFAAGKLQSLNPAWMPD